MVNIILTVSIILNISLLGLVIILWNIRCKSCSKDKEFRRVFSKHCLKCEDNSKDTEKPRKTTKLF